MRRKGGTSCPTREPFIGRGQEATVCGCWLARIFTRLTPLFLGKWALFFPSSCPRMSPAPTARATTVRHRVCHRHIEQKKRSHKREKAAHEAALHTYWRLRASREKFNLYNSSSPFSWWWLSLFFFPAPARKSFIDAIEAEG